MNIKELRKKYHITQTALSKETGIPRDRIAKWEQSKGSPKFEDQNILLKFFEKIDKDNNSHYRENVPRETIAKEPKAEYETKGDKKKVLDNISKEDGLIIIIKELSEGNRITAEAVNKNSESVKISAESVNMLVQSNKELVDMLKSVIAGAAQETNPISERQLLIFQEFVFEQLAKSQGVDRKKMFDFWNKKVAELEPEEV